MGCTATVLSCASPVQYWYCHGCSCATCLYFIVNHHSHYCMKIMWRQEIQAQFPSKNSCLRFLPPAGVYTVGLSNIVFSPCKILGSSFSDCFVQNSLSAVMVVPDSSRRFKFLTVVHTGVMYLENWKFVQSSISFARYYYDQ